ncbi:MAG: sodium-dependent transporter [Phycisphaerae bacterium]|nr:sodium-dependent transporter [Phycisphaerae bacterium]
MAELSLREEQRENWGSRAGFVLAAIGSAVGLGNLWGFPYKLYSTGGGAFLIPYVIAMLLIGIPLLIAEFSLGHLSQRATPDAFGRANRKFAFVGWWQIILSFIIVTFYAVILAYCLSFLYYSVTGIFSGSLPWAGQGVEGVTKAKGFFKETYLSRYGGMQWHIVGVLAITWLMMYLCIFRGVKLVSKVVLWTVPIPWVMLLILTIRGVTLPGAMQGLEYYLEPDWMQLASPETWRKAFAQMFFSMSLAFGVMITYASFLHRKSDLNNNASIIGLADLGTSFVAGLAVFATLGGMAYASQQAGNAVPVEGVADKGPGLVFVAFPYALAQLPYAAWFSTLFFASLLLLGIDSAFSITECILASVVDKTGWNRDKTLIGISLVGLGAGVLYCLKGGLNWIGTIDDFVNGTWGIALTALLECLVLGWLFRLRRLRQHANERSDWKIGAWWTVCIRVVIPVAMAALFAWSLYDDMTKPKGYFNDPKTGEFQIGMVVGLVVMGLAPILAIVIGSLRFKSAIPDEPITHDYSEDKPHGRAVGVLSILLGIASIGVIVRGFHLAMTATYLSAFTTMGSYSILGVEICSTSGSFYASVAAAFALAALLLSGLTVVRLEARTIRTSMLARLGAGVGTLSLGLAAGFGLAMFVAGQKAMQASPAAEIAKKAAERYDGELSLAGYIIIAGMLGLITLGLGWCFYRAIRAAAVKAEPETQEAEM